MEPARRVVVYFTLFCGCEGRSPTAREGAGAVRGDTQGKALAGRDQLPERTGLALISCP